jgi:sugar phosphate isomerase/epimerase
MRTSFSTLACPDWTLAEILRAGAAYGYDGVELRVVSRQLDLWNMPEFRPNSLAATRSAIEDHGLQIPSIGSSACFHSPDAQERSRNLDLALRMAEVAAGLGSPSIRVFGDRIQPGCGRGQTAEWIADSLDQLVGKLRTSGIQVWLETHGDFASAADVSEIFELLNGMPEVGMIWDPANAFEQGKEAPLINPQMSCRIRHVHLKDFLRDTQGHSSYVLTGQGEFPMNTMLASLAAIDYDGFVSFEWEKHWHPELAAPEIALPHFIRWWENREAAW